MRLSSLLVILWLSAVCLRQFISRGRNAAASAPVKVVQGKDARYLDAWLLAYATYGWPVIERRGRVRVKPKCGGKGKKQ